MEKGTIYLFPCPIGDTSPERVLPARNAELMRSVDYYIVENVRSARRFLSSCGVKPIDKLEFVELNEHTRPEEIDGILQPILEGRTAGVISEAGVPAVADPGADIVAAAHRHGVEVIPLVGPSSIIMALMASGMNGQSFAFNGYLPVKPAERAKAIRHFERRARTEHQSQIFIETPYRNSKLLEDMIANCQADTRLTVAVDISGANEFISTRSIKQWSQSAFPDMHKRPAIFIIGL